MKRYKLVMPVQKTKHWYLAKDYMNESPNGEWVLYGDVKVMVEGVTLEAESTECNCRETARAALPKLDADGCAKGTRPDFSWICPAHGYKRL